MHACVCVYSALDYTLISALTHSSFILYRSTFSEFAAKFSKDERFRALEKMREREQLFNEYLVEMKKTATKQKEELKASNKTKAEKVGKYTICSA